MASDIAQSLIDAFKTSFDELQSGLPTEFNNLLSDIRQELDNRNIEETWTHENISILYHLDEVMTECKHFTMEKKSRWKSLTGPVRGPDDKVKDELRDIKKWISSIEKAIPLAPPTYPTYRYTYDDPIDPSKIIIGFDDYKRQILGRLLSPTRDGFIGIGIHGMCGTGKTTLVKYVLQDPELRKFKPQKSDVDSKSKSNVQEEFKLQDSDVDSTSMSNVGDQFKQQNSDVDLKSKSNVQDKFKLQDSDSDSKSGLNVVWVCLSDITSLKELDNRIVKHILEELGHDTDEWTGENPSLTDVGLLEKLGNVLQDLGNYIIVLDDLWHCNDWFGNLMVEADGSQRHNRFSHILPEFKDGCGRGAVIVTTRIKKVAAKMVGENNLIPLEPLKEEELKMLVNGSGGLQNPVDEVAHHCHGLPFVATMSDLVDKQIIPKEQEAPPKEVDAKDQRTHSET